MVKTIIVGIWISVVTLGSLYGAMVWQSGKTSKVEPGDFFGKLEEVKTDTISVPIIHNSKVAGYVLAKFVFLADAVKLKQMSVQASLVLNDEAFRSIYKGTLRDFEHLERYDLAALTNKMKATANKRFGTPVIKDVLIDSINYISGSELRNRRSKKQS